MSEKLNSHGVDVSKIKKGDRVICNGAAYEDHRECIGGIVRKINISVIDVEGGWLNGSPRLYVRPDQIVRHIPADEPMPAPQPVRLGDKPAREMTVRERLICDLFVRSLQWQADSDKPVLRHPDDCIMDADYLLAAIEGSAGK